MKFSLIAALVVVLALAQGSLSAEVSDIERITQYFEDMKNKLTQELTETIQTHDLAAKTQTFLEDRRTELEPVAAQIHEQLRSVAANVEEQLKPMAASVQAQVQPILDNFQRQMETMLRTVMDKSRPVAN